MKTSDDKDGAPTSWRPRPAEAVELAVALALTSTVLFGAPWALVLGLVGSGVGALAAPSRLSGEDPAVWFDFGAVALRSLALVVPIAVAFVRAKRHRLVWVPLVSLFVLLGGLLVHHGWSGPAGTAVLLAVAAGATLLQTRPWARAAAGLPLLMAMHPTATTHQSFISAATAYDLCRDNPGQRVSGLEAANFGRSYYSVTAVGDRYLLTGDELGLWLEDRDGALTVAGPSSVDGLLWQGTTDGTDAYLASRDRLVRVRWTDDGEQVEGVSLVETRDPGAADILDVEFDPATGDLFLSEFATGGLLRFAPGSEEGRRHPLGLFYLQIALREPGRLVGVSTTELVTIDTNEGRITSRRPAAIAAGGMDVCPLDGAAAVTDYGGRVRVFEEGPEGYTLESTHAMSAPRRVRFSPDCLHLAVGSADDTTVSVFRRRSGGLELEQTLSMGPALRDLTWTADGDLLVADACGASRVAL